MAVQSQFQELKKKRCVIFQDESPCHAWNLILRQRAQYIPQQITVAHHHVSEKGLKYKFTLHHANHLHPILIYFSILNH